MKAAIPHVMMSADKKELEPVTPSSTVTLNSPSATRSRCVDVGFSFSDFSVDELGESRHRLLRAQHRLGHHDPGRPWLTADRRDAARLVGLRLATCLRARYHYLHADGSLKAPGRKLLDSAAGVVTYADAIVTAK
jgi:hypothetical protein